MSKHLFSCVELKKKNRVQNICRKHFKGDTLKDNRGGDTRSKAYELKRKCIANFMNTIKTLESHYCRGKSKRQYLSSELSINKLWRLHNQNCEDVTLRVKKSFFRNFINVNYNIGFGSSMIDACSTCLELTEKLKNCSDTADKVNLITMKRVHSLRAKAFYNLLKHNSNGVLVLSYDC